MLRANKTLRTKDTGKVRWKCCQELCCPIWKLWVHNICCCAWVLYFSLKWCGGLQLEEFVLVCEWRRKVHPRKVIPGCVHEHTPTWKCCKRCIWITALEPSSIATALPLPPTYPQPTANSREWFDASYSSSLHCGTHIYSTVAICILELVVKTLDLLSGASSINWRHFSALPTSWVCTVYKLFHGQ